MDVRWVWRTLSFISVLILTLMDISAHGIAQGCKTTRDTVQVYLATYMTRKFNLQVQIRVRVPYV